SPRRLIGEACLRRLMQAAQAAFVPRSPWLPPPGGRGGLERRFTTSAQGRGRVGLRKTAWTLQRLDGGSAHAD
ncbi:MAG: hypothetical protein WCG26_12740, partial [Chloroflexales bacterium]